MTMGNTPILTDLEETNAPWNERENPTVFFAHDVSVMLEKKNIEIPTDEYEEVDDIYETENVDWEREYENNCITLSDMLSELKTYVEQDLAMTGKNTGKSHYLERLLEACQGWEVIETCIEEV